jgi:hypothetical protein
MTLTLRRTGFDDPEDWAILDNSRGVGRIYRTTGGLRGACYAWFVYGGTSSADTPS